MGTMLMSHLIPTTLWSRHYFTNRWRNWTMGFQLMVSNPESELFNTVLPFKVFKDRIWYLFFEKITDNLSNNTEKDRMENRIGDRKVPSLKKFLLNFLVEDLTRKGYSIQWVSEFGDWAVEVKEGGAKNDWRF